MNIADSRAVKQLLRKTDAIDAAKALAADPGADQLTLGGVLLHLWDTGAYMSLGYSGSRGFAKYAKAELGLSYRKAVELKDAYVASRGAPSKEERTRAAAEKDWITKLNFRLAAPDAHFIVQAIAEAKEVVGNDDPNAALALICTEWLNLTKRPKAMAKLIAAHKAKRTKAKRAA
jgi:hypothetical protein